VAERGDFIDRFRDRIRAGGLLAVDTREYLDGSALRRRSQRQDRQFRVCACRPGVGHDLERPAMFHQRPIRRIQRVDRLAAICRVSRDTGRDRDRKECQDKSADRGAMAAVGSRRQSCMVAPIKRTVIRDGLSTRPHGLAHRR
jgi:hypothetical protein